MCRAWLSLRLPCPLPGNRETSPTRPMILAASIGPTPKTSVREVAEVPTSSRMRTSKSETT